MALPSFDSDRKCSSRRCDGICRRATLCSRDRDSAFRLTCSVTTGLECTSGYQATRVMGYQMENEMTKSKLLSAALVAAVMLATPAMASTSHVLPSAPCFKMNAFCASENFDAFIALRSSQPKGSATEDSTQKRSSLRGVDHCCRREDCPGTSSLFTWRGGTGPHLADKKQVCRDQWSCRSQDRTGRQGGNPGRQVAQL